MDDAPRRTVSIKLDVPEQRRGGLHQTNDQFLHCANRTSDWAWRYDDYCITSKSKAEDALYDDLRDDKQFACQDCGYEANADYNAAKNIAVRYCGYIHRGQKSRGGWATSGDTKILRGAVHDVTEQRERQQELETERRFVQQALDSLEDLFLVGIGRDLTERRQRERRFRALVEGSNDVISIVDADGRYQYQSPSLERILGHDPGETVGDTAWEYIHPDDRERVLEQFEMWVTSSGQVGDTVEYRARHADGSWRWMEANSNNHIHNPVFEGYVINSRDITSRRERERELAQTRDLLSSMEELADVGAWEYDSETETLTITDGTRRLYGSDPEETLTLDRALDAIHPDDRDVVADQLDTCLETGEPYERGTFQRGRGSTTMDHCPRRAGERW